MELARQVTVGRRRWPVAAATADARARHRRPARSSKIQLLVPALLDWFALNARDLPWRRTLDPYGIWVSEIMLQQTQVKTVIPYWERWMGELPTVQDLASAKPERVLKLWEGLGYYTRARNLQRAAQQIVNQHGGGFPKAFDQILALPGAGRYTAGAIASIAFDQPTPILDGNVIRVLTRLFAIAQDPREKATNARLWHLATQLVQTANSKLDIRHSKFLLSGPRSALNQSLMELGALVCTPRAPICEQCPVRRHCVGLATGRVESIPNLAKRAAVTTRRFVAVVAQRHGKWLVRQRPAGVLNAHLWEFPNTEIGLTATDLNAVAASLLHTRGAALEPLTTVKHSITRYRIGLEAYLATHHGSFRKRKGDRALALPELQKLAFTSAHRKVLEALRSVTTKSGRQHEGVHCGA
jgi:A/G-specific adenine glycosylase